MAAARWNQSISVDEEYYEEEIRKKQSGKSNIEMKKSIKSRDGKIEVKYDEVENVCICVVIYALLLYLLSHKLDTILKHTVYVFDEGVSQNIRSKLPSVFIRSRYPQSFKYKILRKIIRFNTALSRQIKHPYIKKASIYAQDGTYPSILIGNNNYALLTDGPNFFTMHANNGSVYLENSIKKSKSIVGRMEKIIYGAPFISNLGNNSQCTQIYLTEPNASPLLKDKELIIHSLKELWGKAEDEKKEFILYLFDITPDDISLLKTTPIFFFSQPCVVDGILTNTEYVGLLSKIFSKYDLTKLLVKTHPRDTFDYKKYFPEVKVFAKPVNMQLLSLLNLSFEKAVTIFSSAVFDLPENIEVDWFGVDIHPKIKQYMGNNCIPPRPYNQMSL